MRGILIRWLLTALGLILVSYLFTGIHVSSLGRALIAAMVLGVLNALIRPVVFLFTLPINILTLGLFTLVINAFMLWLTGWLLEGFDVEGFWTAVGGGLVLSLISLASSYLVGDRGKVEIITMTRSGDGSWTRRQNGRRVGPGGPDGQWSD